MRVYIVEAFSAEQYSHQTWVDSVFSSLESAQSYINKYRDKNGFPVLVKAKNGHEYFLSSYITPKTVKTDLV